MTHTTKGSAPASAEPQEDATAKQLILGRQGSGHTPLSTPLEGFAQGSLAGQPPHDVADIYSDEGYYAVIPEWVLDAEVSAQAVRLYAVLRRYADQRTMHAHPSRKTLADRLQVKDEKVVDRALGDLQRIGAVTVFPRWRNEAGAVVYRPDDQHRERTSNGYRLNRTPVLIQGGGGGAETSTPSSSRPHGGGVGAPTVGAQKGEEPQPVEPQVSLPSGESARADDDQVLLTTESDKPAKAPRRKTRLSPGWEPSEQASTWTRENHPTLPRTELDAFRDYHVAHGSTFIDWDAAWRTWVRRWAEPRGNRPGRARPYRNPSGQQAVHQTTDQAPASDGWDAFMAGGIRL